MAVYRPTYKDRKTGASVVQRVWWYEFVYAGRRVRESSGSVRKTIAVEAEKNRRLEFERANAGLPSVEPQHRIRGVADVLKDYAREYGVNHRANSVTMVKNRSAHLVRCLGGLMLSDLTGAVMLDYMAKRMSEKTRGHRPAGRTINLEIEILAAALGHTWKTLWPRVKKLAENRDVGRALERDEERAILETAARNQSRLIYPFLFTLAWTGLRSDEARVLRWSQVDFTGAGEITVGDSKTDAGKGRRIPMSANLRAALSQHAAWCAQKLGPLQPCWYVFPHCNRLAPDDALRPVTSLKTAWRSVRKAAKVNCRLHDLRHSFCTKMAEAGVPEGTMLDIMGHMSTAMLRRYSHIRSQARREAMDALESRHVPTISPKVIDLEGAKKPVTH
ncbi:MAG TPA: site-specific integrase [Bryobacteraceae bacterium]|nr:site-specific integrase [Bryobacteraceae bacterium]HZW92042.1 site-specific integrase [Candidatus Eremiobacteraceae bacterium]